MRRGRCLIGTSGWSYTDWARGRFYPRGLPRGEWLRFFAKHFPTVEINSSFYRVPRVEYVSRWRRSTTTRFRFAVKLWRGITHHKRLVDCSRDLERFFDVVNRLGPKRGPLLVQLPPNLRVAPEALHSFLEDARAAARPLRWRIAVELREPSSLNEEVMEILTRNGAALCLSDMPRCPVSEPNDAGFVYVRRHGPGGRYRGCYSPGMISADARRVGAWLRGGRDVFVYYNNDVDGHAIENARSLLKRIEASGRRP